MVADYESQRFHNSSNWMLNPAGGVHPSATSPPIERLQPVCQPDQHTTAQLQQLETGPGGQGGRRIHPRLGRGEGIFLSLVLLDWVVFSEAGASGGTLPSNDHAPVASPAMVSQTPSAGDSSAQATADVSEPPLGSGPGAPSLGDDGAPASSRLAAVRHSFAGQGRSNSAQVVKLHLASWGRNTERAYASAFNVWASWGASLSPRIAGVLQFLSDHYGQGRQYWTVAVTGQHCHGHCLLHVEVLLVGQHPLGCRLLRGIYNQRPPLPRYQATRDVRKVLDLLCKCGPSPQLVLPQLTRKTCFSPWREPVGAQRSICWM